MIQIRVPATTANIGPGYDTLGLALNLYHEIEVEPCPPEAQMVVWEHAEQAMPDSENLVLTGMQAAFDYFSEPFIPCRLRMTNCEIPASRGLGSSAAAYVSGVTAGLYLLSKTLDKQVILEIASRLEGHPDNVAPAVFGGLVASCMCAEKILFQPVHFGKPLQFIALIPDQKLSTQEARSALPPSYSKQEVVFNLSRLSLLLSALQNGAYELLKDATQDALHQNYRLALMPDTSILEALRDNPLVYGGFVSGAGSTYMLMCPPEDALQICEAARTQLAKGSAEWRVAPLDLDNIGTRWEVR